MAARLGPSAVEEAAEKEGVVLGAAAVREMASDLNDDGLECQGTDTLGLGGWAVVADLNE